MEIREPYQIHKSNCNQFYVIITLFLKKKQKKSLNVSYLRPRWLFLIEGQALTTTGSIWALVWISLHSSGGTWGAANGLAEFHHKDHACFIEMLRAFCRVDLYRKIASSKCIEFIFSESSIHFELFWALTRSSSQVDTVHSRSSSSTRLEKFPARRIPHVSAQLPLQKELLSNGANGHPAKLIHTEFKPSPYELGLS